MHLLGLNAASQAPGGLKAISAGHPHGTRLEGNIVALGFFLRTLQNKLVLVI
jgi:hypothetical protein